MRPITLLLLSGCTLWSTASAQNASDPSAPEGDTPEPPSAEASTTPTEARPPADETAETPTEPAHICKDKQWKLDGAQTTPGSKATFRKKWQESLDEVVKCLETDEAFPRTCVQVQGRFDATPFGDPSVVRTFGSTEAAQNARARGRSSIIISHLHERGIDGWRLREVPPPMKPTYRGAQVTFLDDCVPPATVQQTTTVETTTIEAAPVATPPATSNTTITMVAPPAAREGELPLHLTFAVAGDLMSVDEETDLGTQVRVGLEWRNDLLYTHLHGGFTWAPVDTREVGGDLMLGAGFRVASWFTAGLFGNVGVGAEKFYEPWNERFWAFGLELGQCIQLYDTGRLCFDERFAPIGERTRRAVMVGDRLFPIPLETHWMLRGELALGFRQQF